MPTGHDPTARPCWIILQAMLQGHEPLDSNPAIASWARLEFYRGAEAILARPVTERRGLIDRLPVGLRGMMEAEVKRVWGLQREG